MTDQRAIPTEYKGIRFRSKSEACFAKYLDHYQKRPRHAPMIWEYEPQPLTLEDGYTPDFRLIWAMRSHLECSLIEYKPAMPTETYAIAVLTKLNILANSVAMECGAWIVCGSFWDNSESMKARHICLDGGELRVNDGWLSDGSDEWLLRQQIAQTRFDLASELSQWKGHLHG